MAAAPAAATEDVDKHARVMGALDATHQLQQAPSSPQPQPLRDLVDDDAALRWMHKDGHVLNDHKASMLAKVKALIETWREFAALDPMPNLQSLHNLTQFLHIHTLNVVLSVKWLKYKNEYQVQLEENIRACMAKFSADMDFKVICTKQLALIKEPWSKPDIQKMLNSSSPIPTEKEYNFFVHEESALIITIRLKKLCEDKCGDMALNLTRCYQRCCEWAEERQLSMRIMENQKKFMFDIYLSLLYQHDGIGEMANLLKKVDIGEGVQMVRRFAHKIASKMWTNHNAIAKLSGTIFLTRCVMLPYDQSESHLLELLNGWTELYANDSDANEELIGSLRRIIKNALTASTMYVIVDHLTQRFGVVMRPYCVEVCIQAINTDLNHLERAKSDPDALTSHALDEVQLRVADGFTRLANQFADNLHVTRECVLTSFSVRPTRASFERIEAMARASGCEVLDTGQWRCRAHPPPDAADDEEVLMKCEICDDYMSELRLNPALRQENAAVMESFRVHSVGLPSELCDDLVVIIFGARYQMLSWLQRWSDLQRLCVMYLHDPVRTKNLITDLKFVDIDYTPFMIKKEMVLSEDEAEEPYVRQNEEEEVDDTEAEDFEFVMQLSSKRRRVLSSSSEGEPEQKMAEGTPLVKDLVTEKKFISEITDEIMEEVKEKAFTEEQVHNKCSDPEVLVALKSFRRQIRRKELDETITSSPTPANTQTSHSGTNISINCNSIKCENGEAVEAEVPTTTAAKNYSEEADTTQHQQEFGNFRHDAENYEIDRLPTPQPPSPPPSPNLSSHKNCLDFYKRQYGIKECSISLVRCDATPRVEPKAVSKLTMRLRNKRVKRKSSENVQSNLATKLYAGLNNNTGHRRILATNNNLHLEALKKRLLDGGPKNKMNPVVLLRRLEDSCRDTLLSRVPGVHDTQLFRPIHTNRIVNVVQVAGGRSNSTVQSPNTQTSTQVSPHIQRIGQPRNEKQQQQQQETVEAAATTTGNAKTTANTYTLAKPASTQSSTLINILSQQINRPSMSNNNNSRGRINIISQPVVRAASTLASAKTSTTANDASPQLNNAPIATTTTTTTARIIATTGEQQQILNQIVNTTNRLGTVKAVVDGKLIPVTSFPSNRLVKVGTATPTTAATPVVADANPPAAGDDAFAKLKKTETDAQPSLSETLPKFQQAFGKSVYQNSVDGAAVDASSTNASPPNTTNNDTLDKKPNVQLTKTVAVAATQVNVQPIQGGVIYTRQMPVGQTINLIQQNRGQVFRIATTNADVKDTAIHSKMSALLAAALQGNKPKHSEEDGADGVATTTRVQIARPSLVQNARIVKPMLQIPSNVIRNTAATQPTNLSSTTLEQLREFDMVYKQVKERSSTSTPSEAGASENEASPQRISVTYLNQTQKINCAPVVVVSSYANLQPVASPALSVASQGSSSPSVTPQPTSSVLPKVTAKTTPSSSPSTSSSSKGKTVKNSPLHAAKTSPIPKPAQKPQEDEHTTQRIFDILAEYAEQLRNSPDLNNKPAPRRRSNPPTNPSQNSKRKKSSSKKSTGQSMSTEAADVEDPRTVGSEDSSCGVVQLSMPEEDNIATTASASESNDSTNNHTVTVSAPPPQQQPLQQQQQQPQRQQLILTDATSHAQTRMIITDSSSVGEALKIPNTAVLVPGNYIMPVSMVKGGQQIAVVSGGSKILATVPARSGPNMLLFQSFLNQNRKTNVVPTSVKYSTIQPLAAAPVILPPPVASTSIGQPITIKKEEQLLLTIAQPKGENAPDSSTSGGEKVKIAAPTPVISQVKKEPEMLIDMNASFAKVEPPKTEERVQSVLVTAGTSNGPMLSHSPPQYKQLSHTTSTGVEQVKDDFLRNGGKRAEKVQSTVFCVQQGKVKKTTIVSRMDREVQQMCMQRRQAAIDRELRLQKSLSEECEDLGVDEPSTSDLFPEALLFDANNSPSFDQTSHDALKRSQHEKEDNKLTLFSDDDFIFEAVQYDANDDNLCYEEVVDSRILSNGQGGPTEDTTLLQTCTSMSDVTLSSPISPENYHANTPPLLNKYMHKYTNKKKDKVPKPVDAWSAEVSSSEDTMGSTGGDGGGAVSTAADDEEFKVVHIVKGCKLHSRDGEVSDEDEEYEEDACTCCNGADETTATDTIVASETTAPPAAVSRKRPAQQPQANSPHKKAFPSRKR